MTLKAIREIHGTRPFRAFEMILADAHALRVPHPEFLILPDPGEGRTVIFFHEGSDSAEVIDLLLVISLRYSAPRPSDG
jgi:hypothetical protein